MPTTLIMLDGGHRITVKGMLPTDVEDALNEVIPEESGLVYLQPPDRPANSIAIKAHEVVALVRTDNVQADQPKPRYDPVDLIR